MTSILTSQLPAGQTLEMPCNNLLTTVFQTASESGLGLGAITGVLFVDGTHGTATGTGAIGSPVQTLQQAMTRAAALGYTNVTIWVAPGVYPAIFTVPLGLTTCIRGWSFTPANPLALADANTVLSGNVTIVGANGTPTRVAFVDVTTIMTIITAADPLTQDIELTFIRTTNAAGIDGNVVEVVLQESNPLGNIGGTNGVSITTDGYSWARLVTAVPTITPGYTRTFLDAGHDIYTRLLTINGVPVFPAVGSTAFLTMATPGFIEAGDRVSIQVEDPAVQDFVCGIHGVGAGSAVTAWITNLSRVSTNFNDTVLLTIHHNDMTTETGP